MLPCQGGVGPGSYKLHTGLDAGRKMKTLLPSRKRFRRTTALRRQCRGGLDSALLLLLLSWALISPAAEAGRTLRPAEASPAPIMQARQDPASGQIDISESGKPVLRYNYKTVEPGEVLDKVTPANRIYARASERLHPPALRPQRRGADGGLAGGSPASSRHLLGVAGGGLRHEPRRPACPAEGVRAAHGQDQAPERPGVRRGRGREPLAVGRPRAHRAGTGHHPRLSRDGAGPGH